LLTDINVALVVGCPSDLSAVTLAELSAGPHEVRPDTEQDVYFEAAERARCPAAD